MEAQAMRVHRTLSSVLIPLLLTACTHLVAHTNGIPVSIHGVNHTDRPFRYVLIDPKDPTNSGGGEHIGPFGAGGSMCCYTLPKQWVPGLQVQVRATHWERYDANGKLPEIRKIHTMDIPRYVDGKPGELWVSRTKDGSIELVSSNVQPDHPDWPGKLKGWPEPTIEYHRERWELYRQLAEDDVTLYRDLIAELEANPQQRLRETWISDKKSYYWREVEGFTGPEDPAYAAYRRKEYAEGLQRSEAKLARTLKEKP